AGQGTSVPLQPPGHVPISVPEGEKQLQVPEISLWTVVAAVQAVERKVESQALRLLSLEGRAETAEKKITDLEKAVLEFGSQLERKWAALASLVQENTRRLENVERQLQNRSCWPLRPPLGPNGDMPKVTQREGEVLTHLPAVGAAGGGKQPSKSHFKMLKLVPEFSICHGPFL
uniref:Uncharacterized protein n=1 Tax=Dromaius novaehollandiae TaxID=8790 RepID=A0A8C4PD41_DRONO